MTLTFPFIPFILSTFLVIKMKEPKDWTEVGLALLLFGIWFLCLIPVSSFIYSKIILKNSSKKFVYTLWNSFLIVLSCLIGVLASDFLLNKALRLSYSDKIIMLIILVWSEIWGLLGLIRKRDKKEDEDEISSER